MDYKSFALNDIDRKVFNQGLELAKSMAYEGQKIRLMPDSHVGASGPVGFVSTYSDKIIPNTVGVDVGCRVTAFNLPYEGHFDEEELQRLDEVINEVIPTGFNVRQNEHSLSESFSYENLYCWDELKNHDRLRKSMGTLGGGNHYIELDWDDESQSAWLVIHCGSRNLGKQVAEYYQNKAIVTRNIRIQEIKEETQIQIDYLKAMERYRGYKYIQYVLQNGKELTSLEPSNTLCYIEGEDLENYLNDMRLCNDWSFNNHLAIYAAIAEKMEWAGHIEDYLNNSEEFQMITCIHNYVDVDNKIIRKGAISAYEDQIGLIPLNMRDGILVVLGKGNEDWLWSLPHGAGRVMSRKEAKENIELEDFEETMGGIYSTSIGENTVDEAPDAYKAAEDLIKAIAPNAEIIGHWYPLYNFKDHSE